MQMNDLIPIVELVDLKRGSDQEFFINFFEACNLRCSFCWQDHNDFSGIDDIPAKAEMVLSNYTPGKVPVINIMGGELFMDELPDSVFDDYLEFARRIAHLPNHTLNIVTNLVFNKVTRVVGFLDTLTEIGVNYRLTTSYDPKGRFTERTFSVFERNLETFMGDVECISVVLTKPNIVTLMAGDERFERLAITHHFFFDYYSPEKNVNAMLPTEDDIVDFLIWLNGKYPTFEPVRSMRVNGENQTSCKASVVILPDGEVGGCRLLADKKQFRSPVQDESIGTATASFVTERGCMQCQHFQYCVLGCFLQSDHLDYTISECAFKRLYGEIREY